MAPLFAPKQKEEGQSPQRDTPRAFGSINRNVCRSPTPRTPLGEFASNTAHLRPTFKCKPYETPPESIENWKRIKSRNMGHQLLSAKENGPQFVKFQDRKRDFATEDDAEETPPSHLQRKKTKVGNHSLAAHIQTRRLELQTLRPCTELRISIEEQEWQDWNKLVSISSKAVLINPRGIPLDNSSTAYPLSENIFVVNF